LREENERGTILRHDRIMRKRDIGRVNRGKVEAMK
jgi:hypothetical protein